MKGRYDKKAFRRLLDVLLSLFDMHLSERHIRLKVPSGEYGLSFVAFKRFLILCINCDSNKISSFSCLMHLLLAKAGIQSFQWVLDPPVKPEDDKP
jgi:hypothetical protein